MSDDVDDADLDPPDDEQDLLLELPLPTRPRERLDFEVAVEALDEELAEAVDAAGVGEGVGYELDDHLCTLFFCGPDAAALLAVLRPLMKRSPLGRGAHFVRTVADGQGGFSHQRLPV
ncbi:MAG: hypothetical protein JNK49_17100 [Planctomycetes bacterium]|nr:hypothetical protein [Planctomycetota bacterium]